MLDHNLLVDRLRYEEGTHLDGNRSYTIRPTCAVSCSSVAYGDL